MDFSDLTPEQRGRIKACKTPEDVLALAKAEGYELSNEELKGVSGGSWLIHECTAYDPLDCPEDAYIVR